MTSETRRTKKFDEFFEVDGVVDWEDEVNVAEVAWTFVVVKVAGHADVVFVEGPESKVVEAVLDGVEEAVKRLWVGYFLDAELEYLFIAEVLEVYAGKSAFGFVVDENVHFSVTLS
jgi:hypothetical protein